MSKVVEMVYRQLYREGNLFSFFWIWEPAWYEMKKKW